MSKTKSWLLWSVRISAPHFPFIDPKLCWQMWNALRDQFPITLAATLMPNHFHITLDETGAEHDLRKLRAFCGWTKDRFFRDTKIRWEPIETPKKIADAKHLRRVVRYVPLNPCRAKILKDPFLWPWSTLRGTFGATAMPWAPLDLIERELHYRGSDFKSDFFRYVTSDEDVAPSARRVLIPARESDTATHSIEEICSAATATLERGSDSLRLKGNFSRRLAVRLAHRTGWYVRTPLALRFGVSAAAITLLGQRSISRKWTDAGMLTLGDPRLRWTPYKDTHFPEPSPLAPSPNLPRSKFLPDPPPWVTEELTFE